MSGLSDTERLIVKLKNHLGRDLTPEETKLLKLSVPAVLPIPVEATNTDGQDIDRRKKKP